MFGSHTLCRFFAGQYSLWRITLNLQTYRTHDTSEWNAFILPWGAPRFRPPDEGFFKANAVLQIIYSFITAARLDNNFLAVILEANILGLLRPFLQQEFQGTPQLMWHDSERLMVYDTTDFDFLAVIRERGLRKLYPPIPGGDTYLFNVRRTIISRAFSVVLGRERNISEVERLYQAIDLDED